MGGDPAAKPFPLRRAQGARPVTLATPGIGAAVDVPSIQNQNSYYMREPKQTRSQQTLERILRASVDLFERQGVDATAITEIAERARTSIGSLYGRFDGKTDLVLTVDGLLWERVLARWREPPSSERARTEPDGGANRLEETERLLDALGHALRPELSARISTAGYLEREGEASAGASAIEALIGDVAGALATRLSPSAATDHDVDALEYLARLAVTEVSSTGLPAGAGGELAYVIEATLGALSGTGAASPATEPRRDPSPTDPFDIWA